jgi:urea transport system permease protein
VVTLILVYILCHIVVTSRFGRLLVAARDNENRLRFLGYNLITFKVLVFALSAAIAALAGILYVPQVGIISPSSMGVVPSIEMVVWVAVGGRGTLLGAIIGALAVSFGRSFLSESYPNIWQYFMGALFIGSVLLFPKGIVGSIQHLYERWVRRSHSQETYPIPVAAEATSPIITIQPSQAEGQS